jgi:tetratricopeptide (TPR) repeat protein
MAELAQGLLHPALVRVSAIIRRDPDHPQALALAGKIALFMGEPGSGLAALQRAVVLEPRSDARIWLSLCLEQLGRPSEALEQLDLAIACLPQSAGVQFAVGLMLEKLLSYDKAARLYRAAIALQPDHADAHHHLGRVLHAMGQFGDAVDAFQAAISGSGGQASRYTDLSSALGNLGRFDEAWRAAERAIELDPRAAEAQNNLSHALLNLNRSAEAIEHSEQAIALRPDYARAHFGHALALLKSGDFERGWVEYEWRWRDCQTPRADLAVPAWQGEMFGGTILLHAEQGFGDTLQFVRLVPLVAARGGRVILEVQPALVRLLRSVEGVSEVIASGEALPPVDLHCPLVSLPRVCSLRLDSIPGKPYLRAPKEATARHAGLVVGLVWAGDPRPHELASHLIDRRRSTSLQSFAPLFEVEGVTFASFQLGQARQEIAGFDAALIDGMEGVTDFADTAARLAGIDLLISVDTSMVHLAGGLGKPVWMLSRFDGCWRWLEGREDSPWYPTMRIFRQPSLGNWPALVETVAAALHALVKEQRIAA